MSLRKSQWEFRMGGSGSAPDADGGIGVAPYG